jgi:hypothetical protein
MTINIPKETIARFQHIRETALEREAGEIGSPNPIQKPQPKPQNFRPTNLDAIKRTMERCVRISDKDAEFRPEIRGNSVQPKITLNVETHRLLRAVALKRAQKNPGEEPSISAVLEELVERSRPDLEREAGAMLKKELAKKR